MSADSYFTFAGDSTDEVREKSSRFVAYAFPIADADTFKAKLDEIAKAHHTARHICYAWVLGTAGEQFRSFDAGEPSGSAGKPILRQLQGSSLTFSSIVVVRYFGGTLLGKAGLSHAFAAAAKAALAANTIVEKKILEELHVECGYELVEEVKRTVLSLEGEVLHAEFEARCKLHVAVPKAAVDGLLAGWARKEIEVKRV
jgi:uncharacterized YigZ family protein